MPAPSFIAKPHSPMRNFIEKTVFRVAAIAGIAIGLGEMFGVYHGLPQIQRWIHEQVPLLCLVFFGFIAGSIGEIVAHLHTLRRRISEQGIERIKNLPSHLDPDLARVIGPEVDELVSQVTSIIEKKTLRLTNKERFRAVYQRALQSHPRSHFVATSFPSISFFWRNERIEQTIAGFIKAGGRMERVFFLHESDPSLDDESRRILRIQSSIGVEVYVAPLCSIPNEFRRLVMTDTGCSIGWELLLDPHGNITAAHVSSDRGANAALLDIFNRVIKLDCVRPYQDDGSAADPNFRSITKPSAKEQTVEVEAFKQNELNEGEQSASVYQSLFSPLTNQMIQPLLDALQPQPRDNFLDLATGPGYLAERAHTLGCSVVAVDLSETMILKAQSRKGAAGVEFRIEDAEECLPGKNVYDIVGTNFGIPHFAQPERVAQNVFAALKPGGRFAYTAWAPAKDSAGFFLILRAIETYGSTSVELPPGPPFFRYSKKEMGLGLLKLAGFENCKAHLVPMCWKLPTPQSLFDAFDTGSARIGGILRSQPDENREQIRRSVQDSAARYAHRGSIELPMKAWVYSGVKP